MPLKFRIPRPKQKYTLNDIRIAANLIDIGLNNNLQGFRFTSKDELWTVIATYFAYTYTPH